MGEFEEDWDELDFEEWQRREDEHALSPAGIAEQNASMLRRWREFRCAADAIQIDTSDMTVDEVLARVQGLLAAVNNHSG